MPPIFILVTRSFWLTVLTLALYFAEGPESVRMLSEALGVLMPYVEVDAIADFLFQIAPVVTLLAALQQRSGAARPYSLNPKDR